MTFSSHPQALLCLEVLQAYEAVLLWPAHYHITLIAESLATVSAEAA
jgi:hypothetical protein